MSREDLNTVFDEKNVRDTVRCLAFCFKAVAQSEQRGFIKDTEQFLENGKTLYMRMSREEMPSAMNADEKAYLQESFFAACSNILKPGSMPMDVVVAGMANHLMAKAAEMKIIQ